MMNTIRMIAIALPMTLLTACGSGGDGGVAAVAPMTPDPSTGGGGGPTEPTGLQALPFDLIRDVGAARTRADDGQGNTEESNLTPMQIQNTFAMRAMDANKLVASDAYVVSSTTPNGADVSSNGGVTIDEDTIRVSLAEIQIGVANIFNLTGFNSQSSSVMVDQGVELAQYRAAGRTNDNEVLEYRTYGGWLTESAFSVDMLTINDGSNESSLLVGVSYGEESDSRPTGSGSITWTGPMIGMYKTGGIVQGHTSIRITDTSSNTISLIEFTNNVSITDGTGVEAMSWNNVPIAANGTFSSTTEGDIDGTFYGTTHMEVGGTFNRNNIIGAFGATR